MSFSQALSGLRAQGENIKVISNNIANSQTVGFKNGKVLFADVFAGASSKVGLGVNIAAIMQDFRSGDLENTGRNLDLAIAGEGFYRLEKSNGEIVYSRNGQFNRDQNGFLVNGTGQFLTGYGLSDANDPFSEVIPGGAPQRLQIPQDDIPANATTEVDATYNLDASTIDTTTSNVDLQTTTVVTDPTTDPPTTADINFHFSSSYTVYDSLGNARTVTSYFTKTAVAAGGTSDWAVEIALDGVRADAGTPDFTVSFNANGGLNDDPAADPAVVPDPITIGAATEITSAVNADNSSAVDLTFSTANFDLGGAAELAFTLDLRGTTQFNNNSVQNSLSQDGYTSGSLIGLEVQDDGTITRIYTNEERRAAGQVVLTNFINPEGLQPDGDNAWRESNSSGAPVLGEAGTGTFGTIEGGVLENSNVDLAQELVNMIVSQRAYQANSTSIGTQDEMLQTVINL